MGKCEKVAAICLENVKYRVLYDPVMPSASRGDVHVRMPS